MFVERGAITYGWALEGAGIGGHSKVFDFIANLVPVGSMAWNSGLYGAACGGKRELVDICIQKGSTKWDWGLQGAQRCYDKDLIAFFKAMKSKGSIGA